MKQPTHNRWAVRQAAFKTILSLGLTGVLAIASKADVVYVTALVSNCTSTTVCGTAVNTDLNSATGLRVYDDGSYGASTTAKSSVSDKPPTTGCRYFSNSFSNSTPNLGVTISPHLEMPGAVYRVDHTFSASAGNVSTNVIVAVTNKTDCTLSWTATTNFQSANGNSTWKTLGYLTNAPGKSDPQLTFYFGGGLVNAGSQARLLMDTFKFTYVQPCLFVADVGVTGPLGASSTNVTVTGVAAGATNVTVYQDTGSGMVQVGIKTNGVAAGNNSVPVSGLVKGGKVAATQTIAGQEGCVPLIGLTVGSGANPSIRVALSIRETTSTGPIGASAGDLSSQNIHFLGASYTTSGAPADSPSIQPSNGWQTITFTRGITALNGGVSNIDGALISGPGYNANDLVDIYVFAYRDVPPTSQYPATRLFSSVSTQSASISSNDVFGVHWSWNSVAGADGYRVLREINFAGFMEYIDVPGASFDDINSGWQVGNDISTTSLPQVDPSVRWNPSNLTGQPIPGKWGILESIAFSIDDTTDTGPFDLYIDDLQNGSTVFQDFESVVSGTTDYAFRAPSFSGTTSGNILSAPNQGAVSNRAADSGTKSTRVQFQWNAASDGKWLRLTTSGAAKANPMLDLEQPISLRILLLPVGQMPEPPPAPSLSITKVGANAVLSWTGAHNLQAAPNATGTYTNITGVTTAPYTDTNTPATSRRFFRLVN